MSSFKKVVVRALAIFAIALSAHANEAAAAERRDVCPFSGGLISCTSPDYCSEAWAEAFCMGNGGPDCHQQGYECINWPFSGCGWGEKRPQYWCYCDGESCQ